jgi:hypothetical protein
MSITHLRYLTSDTKIQQLCNMYWELDEDDKFVYTVTSLAKQFEMSSRELGNLVDTNCAASSDITCKICGKPYIFVNRSDYQSHQRYSKTDWICEECSERIRQEAKQKELEEQRKQAEIIRRTFALAYRFPGSLLEISFENAATLLSIIRAGAVEDFSFIAPFWSFKEPLAPERDLGVDFLRQLYQKHLLGVHPDSPIDSVEFENDVVSSIYLERVKWVLPIEDGSTHPKQLAEHLESVFLNMNWAEHWYEEQLSFSRKVALHECLQYLKVCLEEHSFTFHPGEKTMLILNNVLEDYAVAQVFNFIWRASKDAAAFYMREKVPKQQAANTVVGSIQRQAEKARSEGWEIKAYRRDFRCPQSMVSQVLFNAVLQIGDDGFNKPIR